MKTVFRLERISVGQKATYKTRQLDELLAYMRLTKGRHVTVQDIGEYFKEKGVHVGTTTIYRQLEKLVEEKLVAKYVIDPSSGACFEYLGDEEKEHSCAHFHCKCKSCGALLHIDCHQAQEIAEHMYTEHHFVIDPFRTVFYGVCGKCQAGIRAHEEDV